ncbi:recombinase family protein, partial [Bacillus mycoides]
KKVEIDDNFKETYQEWKNHKITSVKAMQRVGMKSNTFYRRVKEYEYSLEKSKFF